MDRSQVISATAHLVHDNGVSANSSSPSTSFYPLTPSEGFSLEIPEFTENKVPMSPPTRPGLLQASSYTYGADMYAGVSSERSTAAMGPEMGQYPQWPPKAEPDSAPAAPMPLMRHTEPAPQWAPMQTYSQPYPLGYPQPQYSPQYYGVHKTYAHLHYQPNYIYSSLPQAYHHTQPSPVNQLYPTSAPPQLNGGTIQPSAFSSWHNDPRRDMSEPGPEEDRQTERRPSVSSLSETHHESKPSPASVTVSDQDSEYMEAPIPKKKAKKPKPRVKMELVDGDVTFTTDCEVKQTPTLRRHCLNCSARNPPSWRKSVLQPGHILCNKCGIFERTHHRPRPPQTDETRTRRGGLSAYRRGPPSPLSVRGTPYTPGSPFSTTTHTPSSATPGYTFPHLLYTGPQSAQPSMPPPEITPSPTDSFHPAATYSGRRYSHGPTQGYGAASPYSQAYSRRAASYNTTPTLSVMRAAGGMAATADHWEQSRQHSDGVDHSSSSTVEPASPN